ncbi:protein kinase domain-containing protein [Actinocorallia longicatena]|uniref:Protein kinase domain-containing protein n=1 Tax=Actinocorallia longicatena TaxID=111803 RepID=A0ABP6Q2M7_9ACTN
MSGMGTGSVVKDEHGRPLRLDRLLGVGGQGEVWASGSRVAVKLLNARTPRARAALRERLGVVRRLPLDGLPISRPYSMLAEPHAGYTMDLLADMDPLRALSAPSSRDLLTWYAASGGLRRRLTLLAAAADALARLHARGIVYGDPSPSNVLVSADPAHEEIWLIDADNLGVVSDVPEHGYATFGYGAPELIAGTGGISSLSDAHAFAVIVLETIALVHPFLGDAVEEAGPEEQDRAFSGGLPWIDDPDDARNRSSNGLDREVVLTLGLRKLAARTFGEGLHRPCRRPSLGEWRAKLRAAADLLVPCTACAQASYVVNPRCSWCGAPIAPPLLAAVGLAVPGALEESPLSEALAVPQGRWIGVRSRNVLVSSEDPPGRHVAWLHWEPGRHLVIRNEGDGPIWLRRDTGGPQLSVEPHGEISVPAHGAVPEWTVHFGAPSEIHRMLRFRSLKGRS